jgi:hypothetical protein
MNIDLRPYLAIWALTLIAVLVLFIKRKMVAAREDDNLHVMTPANPSQTLVATELEKIDKWGKLATVVALVLGLVIAALYLWMNFTGRPSITE